MNPQYAYGWAVPFLCAYLLWRKVAQASPPAGPSRIPAGADVFSPGGEARGEGSPAIQGSEVGGQTSELHPPSSIFYLLLAVCAFLYLPTRLIQEANPEWRLVSWALAIEVIGLTLLTVHLVLGVSTQRPSDFGLRTSDFTFPICFFLVAVPWPTFLEAPLIQGLMRANIGVTTELLGVLGVPAVQHGNVIEIATGRVGIDEACSGIRSLQAALMLSLFFGELYALSARRRALCVLAGFALAFAFNVCRTLLLTQVGVAKGVGAVASWHDPAGVAILVACFLSLWLLAVLMKREKSGAGLPPVSSNVAQASPPASPASVPAGKFPDFPPHSPALNVQGSMFDVRPLRPSPLAPRPLTHHPSSIFHLRWISVALGAWLLLVEGGTELWYRSHEWFVPKTTAWHVEFPRNNPTFRYLPFSDNTRQFLRYDEGLNGVWQEGEDRKWQAIFLRWNPGRIAVHLAKSHTPEVCLTAAGRELVSQSGLRAVPVHGLQLPFRSYVVKDETGPLHVFYCLWDDRASAQSFRTTSMTYANRFAPVLAGRRNSGQRSLEIALWGIADQNEADAAFTRELEKLIKVEK